jgi:hypothetical protein
MSGLLLADSQDRVTATKDTSVDESRMFGAVGSELLKYFTAILSNIGGGKCRL